MTRTEVFGTLLVVVTLVAQALLTIRVWRSPTYDREQKVAQTRLIWLLPILGAVLVFGLMPPEEPSRAQRDDRERD